MSASAPEMKTVASRAFADQKPGTSGLRKKTRVFLQAHYLENFVQAVFETLREECPQGFAGETLVVGGDGRFHNRAAVQTIIKMAAANGFGRVLAARGGILSTPAASAVIRRRGTRGGFVLSASHNPGGKDEDFGIKFNTANGGPAPQKFTDRVYERTRAIESYRIAAAPDIDIDAPGARMLGPTEISVFDGLADYAHLMREIFDFERLKALFARGFRLSYDAMNAVTGPYARRILEEELGAPAGTVLRGRPLEDFGGCHPDPNLTYAAELVKSMQDADAPDMGAASDGDGDRNLILGRNFFVTPGDSLAVITEYAAQAIPGYRLGLRGVARSMPTSLAVDRVAEALGVRCYETPTGWKFFGNLMDAGLCTICGEESFGTGSDHVREKDGLWAVLCWLSIVAHTGRPVADIVKDHWQRHGRSYYQRHDFEGLDAEKAERMLADVRSQLGGLAGRPFAGGQIVRADDFSYDDPVDGSATSRQGLRILMQGGSRVVFRLSGTGTQGATLRVYLESYRRDGGGSDVDEILAPLGRAVLDLIGLKERCGVDRPTVVT